MFSNWFLKSFRILLFPFAFIYGLIVIIRNFLYDKNIFKSYSFGLPLICVGNLSVGGTGKSPMVEYILAKLLPHYKVATLSRGYKRKTRGYALAHERTTAIDIGDEPMLFHSKFPQAAVAVGEQRVVAIPQLLHDKPGTDVIILDDAFQHRTVKAGLNILLTDYSNLFTRDFFLPTGDLRDSRSSKKRADLVVVTKCPADLSDTEKNSIQKELDLSPIQELFFTTLVYGDPYHIIHKRRTEINSDTEVLLVTGIANPEPLKKYTEELAHAYHVLTYSDHHIFTVDDLREIIKTFEAIDAPEKVIITTEKDAVRLLKFSGQLQHLPFYVLPVEHSFLFDEGTMFDSILIKFIQKFKQLP